MMLIVDTTDFAKYLVSGGKMLVVGEGLAGLQITQNFYTNFQVLNQEPPALGRVVRAAALQVGG